MEPVMPADLLFDALPKSVPDPFVLLEKVTGHDERTLSAMAVFQGEEWEPIEAMAQAAALHQRLLADFSDHAFLLSIDRADILKPAMGQRVRVEAELLGQSSRSAGYLVRLYDEDAREAGSLTSAELTIGRMPYADRAMAERLSAHYREILRCRTREQ